MKITAIMPGFNLISGQYPFLEMIATGLPLVDEFLFNDGGSTDGTKEVVLECMKLNPKIKLVETVYKPGTKWESIDEGMELCISKASGDWILEIQADEYYPPKFHENVKRAVLRADSMGKNGIRQSTYSVSGFQFYLGLEEDTAYRNMRFIRNLGDRISSHDGGDCFILDHGHPTRTSHFMPPEYESRIKCINLFSNFPIDRLIRASRHYNFLAVDTPDRLHVYEDAKRMLGIEEDRKEHLEYSIKENYGNYHKFYYQRSRMTKIEKKYREKYSHPIITSMSKMSKYEIREEVFDYIQDESRIYS